MPGRSYVAVWPTGATTLPDGRVLISYAKYRANVSPVVFDFLAGGLYVYDYPGAGGVIRQGTRPAARLAELWTPGDGPVASPVRIGADVYFTQCQVSRCYSLRAPAGRVGERSAYEWWTGGGWSADRTRRRAMSYGADHPGRNPPTAYLDRSRIFVTVDTSHGIQSDSGLIWVAPSPYGPWSRPARFALPGCTASEGCYTLNPHPADSPPGRLRISYATAHDGPHVQVIDVPLRITGSGASLRVDTAG